MGRLVWPAVVVLGVAVACSRPQKPLDPPPGPPVVQPDGGTDGGPDAGDGGTTDGGTTDGGDTDGGTTDGGDTDGGTTDGGTDGGSSDGGTDGGTTDGGTDGGTAHVDPVPLPQLPGWTFYGVEQGGPAQVFGASLDEGGNLWVAGGEEGLFLLRPGASRYEKFTMADGLRPYGYMPDGSAPAGDKYLKVISVAGGPAGTVYVGYAGKPPAPGQASCEDNWDSPNPDPSIYKSGDADKVTLTATGLAVAHYDIFSGPGIVHNEARGREKLCSILRIRYDKANNAVWFGGNHGFALGDASYGGTSACQWTTSAQPTGSASPFTAEYGHYRCSGVLEHVHPAVNGYANDNVSCCVYLTGDYWGVAPDPRTGDVWFGGIIRTTKFKYASSGRNYFTAESMTEDPQYGWNRIDIWPDAVPEYAHLNERVDDNVSGIAALNDGSAWVSSWGRGLAKLNVSGDVVRRLDVKSGLYDNAMSSVGTDTTDGASVWAGYAYGGGILRLRGDGTFQESLGGSVLGFPLANQMVIDIQPAGSGAGRAMVVAFAGTAKQGGAVGAYRGP